MTGMNLQDGIDQAGSPMRLFWNPDAAPWRPPVLPPEFVGWREEQLAGHQSVALSDLSHHMWDTFIEGPDAVRLLSDITANNYQDFVVGQAKQMIAVTEHGHMVSDGILARTGENKFTLTSLGSGTNWVRYHAEVGKYDVSVHIDPDSYTRGGPDPVLFRYQIQGPHAQEVVAKVFGAPLPKVKFFHTTPVTLGGRNFRALRHGMTGQPGYEFIGEWADAEYVKQALLAAGESFGIAQVGADAYGTLALPSGWVPCTIPAIYTQPELADYRKRVDLYSYEGQHRFFGSYFSENMEDYYVTPYELGYAKSISFNHDFIGRTALEKLRDSVTRKKVTVVIDPKDAHLICGDDTKFMLTNGTYRVEADGDMIGIARYTGTYAPSGTVLALTLIDEKYATPGTDVTFVWGSHPGPGHDPDADAGFIRVNATVQPAPYDDYARSQYRKND